MSSSYQHYQPDLVCALCSKSVADAGYRMHLHVAICNHCVDQLIEKALSAVLIVVNPQSPGPNRVQ